MTADPPTTFAALEARIAAWAEAQPDVRAAMVLGSRARTDTPADAYSDLDLLLLVADPSRYLDATDWLADLGVPRLSFVEETAVGGGRERRVLFDGGLDVDFSVFPVALFAGLATLLESDDPNAMRAGSAAQSPDVARALELADALGGVARRGHRILVDKDGILARALAELDALPAPPTPLPTAHEFAETASDFWYHAVWAVRKLRRGELWIAVRSCDGYLQALLLRMLTWHARATHGPDYETWHDGRFLECWADPDALAALRACFAHYDADDVRAALSATMDLFRRLATQTAAVLGYPYPADGDTYATGLVRALLDADA
jgi:aminoglycoside 6-adenylyltransferase